MLETFLTLLKLVPAVITAAIQSVHAVETGFQAVADGTGSKLAAAGEHKAAVVEAALQTALSDVSGIPGDAVAKMFASARDAVVKAFNALGIFKSSK